MEGQHPFNFNPQGQLCRPEEEKSRRAACRPGVIFLSLQFFRPEISAEISEKTENLLLEPDIIRRFGYESGKRLQKPNRRK
ncbi:MAG: hypothetical protein IK140_10540 [Clostridia bacterium]|nr:hypothetical protein [Clostridia bacterium]